MEIVRVVFVASAFFDTLEKLFFFCCLVGVARCSFVVNIVKPLICRLNSVAERYVMNVFFGLIEIFVCYGLLNMFFFGVFLGCLMLRQCCCSLGYEDRK